MNGSYSNLKLLTQFTIQGINTLYYNLNSMTNDQLKMAYSNNALLSTYIET